MKCSKNLDWNKNLFVLMQIWLNDFVINYKLNIDRH